MTPAQIDTVQASFNTLAPKAKLLVTEFYDEVFRVAPHLRHIFPDDMSEQRTKLIKTLTYAVNGLKFPLSIVPIVQELGVQHRGYSVDPEQYRIIGEALLHAISKIRGPAFTSDEREAWTACYALLSSVMQDAAAAAA
jgi:nitric oxide dioxygenase